MKIRRAVECFCSGRPLGTAYLYGTGVRQDTVEAEKWLRKASAKGNPSVEGLLGFLYVRAKNTETSKAEAVELWKKAAQQEDFFGLFGLGQAYEKGNNCRPGHFRSGKTI